MLIAGLLGTARSLLVLSASSLCILPEGTLRGYLILALTVTFLAFDAGLHRTVTWLTLLEIFPLHDPRPWHGHLVSSCCGSSTS